MKTTTKLTLEVAYAKTIIARFSAATWRVLGRSSGQFIPHNFGQQPVKLGFEPIHHRFQSNEPRGLQFGSDGASNPNGQTTVEGCLSGSSGNYTLSAKDGTSYQLTGDTAKLSEHVGHEVKVTGTSSSAAPNAGGTAAGTTGQASASSQTLEVSSVKHISKTCQNGSMSK